MIEITVKGDKLDEVHELLDRMTVDDGGNFDNLVGDFYQLKADVNKAMEVMLNVKSTNKQAGQKSSGNSK